MANGEIPFVIARPCRLTGGPPAEVRAFGDDGNGVGFMPTISRESVAQWLVAAAETSHWDGKAPVLSN